MTLSVPDDAQCARCGYSLRGLAEPRCPECGSPFNLEDPAPLVVHRGPLGRWLSRPLSAKVYRWQLFGALSVAWGFALLPGGMFLALSGMFISVGLYLFRHAHRSAQLAVLGRFAPALPVASTRYRRWMSVALVLILLTNFDIPVALTVNLVKVAALHQYRYTPSTEFPRHFTFVGCTFAQYETVTPTGVWIDVLGWGTIAFHYRGDIDDLAPLPYSHWPQLEFLHMRVRYRGTLVYGL